MTLSEFRDIAQDVKRFAEDGSVDSANRILLETVPPIIKGYLETPSEIKYLVHYTTVDAIFSLLSCFTGSDRNLAPSAYDEPVADISGYLRMYDTYHSNDPNEGKFFISTTPPSHPFQERHKKLWELLRDRSRLPAYIASFRGVTDLAEVDDLIFWRTYGRDGRGCAIVFPRSFFSSATPLFPVRYGCKKVDCTLDFLTQLFDSLAPIEDHNARSILDIGATIPPYISSSLSPLTYLHKSDDYASENEFRVVIPSSDLPAAMPVFHRISNQDAGTRIRHFAHLNELSIRNILRTESAIMIGPAVAAKENIRFVFGRRLAKQGLVGPKIYLSRIGFRS